MTEAPPGASSDPASGAGLLRDRSARPCPICGNTDDTRERFRERIDPARIDGMSYASRKEPEYMSLRMVVCPICDLLYAPRVPSADFLASAYAETGYDSDAEARFAAASYAESLAHWAGHLPDRASVLEIGAGNGALLSHLRALGFGELVGIEPSRDAVKSAAPDLRGLIRVESFDPARFPTAHFSLIIANQTLEHVGDPYGLISAARSLLKPGGALMIVSHNYRHWLMRLLGARSPIIDIEHLQVFSPASLEFALKRAGFAAVQIEPFSNRYPLHYWTRLLPIPRLVKRPLHAWLRGARPGGWMLRASVGNMMAWAGTLR
ncbi:MAG TPA: class I SAM-dependent methyltransferase [Steroidobacteraceae bacterium]|nr:class I SAM-dependent methyltransferase [Steroidobacteraceae bacterium]